MWTVLCGVNIFAMSHPAYQGLRDIQVTRTDPNHPILSGSWGQKMARLFYSWESVKLRSKAACNLLAAFPLCCQEQACRLQHKEGAICRTVEAWESWERVISGRGWGGAVCLGKLLVPPPPENINISSPLSTALFLSLLLTPNTKAQMKFLKVDYFCLVIFSICC